MNSRYHNPEIGRFISSDGQIGELGNILSTNMYAYCASNPVMYSDTTGYAPETWQIALGVIGAGLVVTAIVMTIFSSGGVGAFGVGALWGSLILGTAGAVIGGVVANAINADILGGILAGFGIGATVGFFVGGTIGYSRYLRTHSVCKPGSIANPDGNGQVHHVFGKNQETLLKNKFGLNRDDYLVRANNLDAHFGYQAWHRAYNKEVLSILKNSRTILELQRKINAIYSTQVMIEKFGLTIISLIP